MQLMEEIAKNGFPLLCTAPYMYCKALEDNLTTLECAIMSSHQTYQRILPPLL